MKKKTAQSGPAGPCPCLCQGAGPALTELLRRLCPAGESRRHFENARLEFLRGLRALLDARIEQVSRRGAKGEKISVE